MKQRNDLKERIEKEITNNVIEYIINAEQGKENDNNFLIYQNFLNSGFLQITPPEEEPPMMHMLTMDSLKNYQQGSSIKPGNIRLNIKKLIETIPSVVEMAISIAINMPILQVCAALNIWKTLRNILTVEISREQAFVIVALWKNCNQSREISLENGYIATNALYEKLGETPISDTKYNHTIDALVALQCIELDEGIVWLREWISKQYVNSI